MKRRVFGFLLGAVLGVIAVYFLRRWRNNNQAVPLAMPTDMPSMDRPTETTNPTSTENPAEGETVSRPSTKHTVRRTGPRPQSPIESADSGNDSADSFTVTRSTEPASATETDQAVASSRADIEAVPEPSQAEVQPANTLVSEKAFTDNDNQIQESQIQESQIQEAQEGDNLMLITGIGQVFSTKLKEQGITTFEELATMPLEEIAEKSGIAQERIEREKWQEQAAQLASEA